MFNLLIILYMFVGELKPQEKKMWEEWKLKEENKKLKKKNTVYFGVLVDYDLLRLSP